MVDDKQPYFVYYTDDTIPPTPVLAESRSDAFSLGRRHMDMQVTAAVGEQDGESFDDVSEDEFITAADV